MPSFKSGNVCPKTRNAHQHAALPRANRRQRINLVVDELDEIEAYRRIDRFLAREAEHFELVEVLDIHEEEVLTAFLSLGFTPRTAPAIEMVPVVFVAWASGEVTNEECAAAVRAIFDSQLTEFPKTLSVVQTWLDTRPDNKLFQLWERYMRCRLESMPSVQRTRAHQLLMSQIRQVARASGGWLGIGSICQEEQLIIDLVDSVFWK